MKTPRQILLDRHATATATADLDRLRHRMVADLDSPRESWWGTAWREVVLAARPAWSVVGAFALVVLGLHITLLWVEPGAGGAPPKSPRDWTATREERLRLWSELGLFDNHGVNPTHPVPRPVPNTAPRRSQLSVQRWPV
ncbi:MAG: hypothetical protein AB7O66_03915 [Limisphaerales bacterium]